MMEHLTVQKMQFLSSWPLHSYTPQGVYDLQIHIPIGDVRRTRPGPYRMQLVVTMNEQYRRKCGNNDYKETRDYTVSIVPHTWKSGKQFLDEKKHKRDFSEDN